MPVRSRQLPLVLGSRHQGQQRRRSTRTLGLHGAQGTHRRTGTSRGRSSSSAAESTLWKWCKISKTVNMSNVRAARELEASCVGGRSTFSCCFFHQPARERLCQSWYNVFAEGVPTSLSPFLLLMGFMTKAAWPCLQASRTSAGPSLRKYSRARMYKELKSTSGKRNNMAKQCTSRPRGLTAQHQPHQGTLYKTE